MEQYSADADDDLKILTNNLGAFLYHRSMRLNGAPSSLPDFVRDMTDRLTQDCAQDKWKIRVYRRVLSNTLARHHEPELDRLIWLSKMINHTKSQQAQNNRVDIPLFTTSGPTLAVAAAAIGSLGTLRDVAEDDRQALWACSDTLGYPIEAASFNGHDHIVKALIRQAVKGSRVVHAILPLKVLAMARSITAALTGHHFSLTQYLFEMYEELYGVMPDDTCMGKWLLIAIRTARLRFLSLLLKNDHQASKQCIYKAFELCCGYSCTYMFKIFFDMRALKVNGVYGTKYPSLRPSESRYLTW
jgi:hypothetical protein